MTDHYAISFSFLTTKPPMHRKVFTSCTYKAKDMEAFASDIFKSRLFSLETDDPYELADTYNSVLSKLLDTHAPLKTKTITGRVTPRHSGAPFFENKYHTY